MAVKLEGAIRRFIGKSTETKPVVGTSRDKNAGEVVVTAHDLPAGSTFLEADTGLIYRWTGDEWLAAPAERQLDSLLHSIDDRLALIVEILARL